MKITVALKHDIPNGDIREVIQRVGAFEIIEVFNKRRYAKLNVTETQLEFLRRELSGTCTFQKSLSAMSFS
ncbi:hypothetical protein PX860_26185 (plasmid) [Agrobacterium leguminum]|uniref:hypothetical protein n=1 Tax=Agrobacterium leguminum TaxID=2792015 RepID=UPI00272B2091|nr:hypothetical protein [Agrobacterium leguminum]WLE00393.1 hypothetical protein PX860_26185 [Agrobacterium leguminum]